MSGSKDRGVQFWDPITGNAQMMLQGHKNSGMFIVRYIYKSVCVSNCYQLFRLLLALRTICLLREAEICVQEFGG